MEIPAKFSKLKFHFLFGVALSLLIFFRIYISPKFVDVVTFFSPLFLSTALFLLAVLVFGRTLPPATEAPGEKVAEVILDLVTGQPLVEQLHPLEEEVQPSDEEVVRPVEEKLHPSEEVVQPVEEEVRPKEAATFDSELKM